jgi:uncharacterized protein (TIGR00369 family)
MKAFAQGVETMELMPRDPQFAESIRASFAKQPFMKTIGASLGRVEAGFVEVVAQIRPELTQQNGFLHGGLIGTLLDTTCGYAAHSLLPKEQDILTAEYKVNFLRPGVGDRVIARGRVVKVGQMLTVCVGDAFAEESGEETLIATMLATMAAVTRK